MPTPGPGGRRIFRMRARRRTRTERVGRAGGLAVTLALALLAVGTSVPVSAAEVSDARSLFNSGKYPECIALCEGAIGDNRLDEDWFILKIRSELALFPLELFDLLL